MKEVWLIFLFFILMSFSCYGQIVDKGNMYIGGFGRWDKSEFHGLEGVVLMRYEYLFSNKLSIGSDLGYAWRHLDKTVMVNPFVRYYFLNKKISPIIATSFYHGFEFDVNPIYAYQKEVSEILLNFGISTPRLLFDRIGFEATSGLISHFHDEEFKAFRFAPITMVRMTYCIRKR